MNSTTHKQTNPRKGFLLALAGTALLSTNYITAKYALRGFDPWTFSAVWCSAAAVYTFIILLLTGRVKKIALPGKSLTTMLVLGLTTGVTMILAWAGLRLIDPSFATFLWRFSPVLTIALAAIFLSEKLTLRLLAPAVVMIAGGLISTLTRWDVVALGTALTLLSCVTNAVQRLIVKKAVSKVQVNVIAFYRVLIAAVAITALILLAGKANFNVQGKYWAALLVGAFLGPCASQILMFRSFVYWDLSRASIVVTAQPLFVLPMAYLAFRKLPADMELIGGLIILAGAFWLALANRQDGRYQQLGPLVRPGPS